MPVSGLANILLSSLSAGGDGDGAGHLRRAGFPSAFVRCENDPAPAAVLVPAPTCIDSGENCSSKEDLPKLQKFAAAIDEGMKEDLKAIKKARETFLRRACDFQYADYEDKGEMLINTYGPKGPLLPGGSYLFELRRWADAAYMLHRACNRGMGGCQSLMEYLKEHPEEDLGPGGIHGMAGSQLYKELRLACEVGKSRSPVPNDGPAWCDLDTGLCEQRSCKKWWRRKHGGKAEPWIDDRLEYDDLKEACNWIEQKKPTSRELNSYQTQVAADTLDDKINFCRPRWIEGYCPEKKDTPKYEECTLQDGKHCAHGRVEKGSEMDDTAGWEEPFKNKPVTVEKGFMPLLLALPMPSELLAVAAQHRREVEHRRHISAAYASFL